MMFLHHAIPIFKGPLKHATWIHDIKMNVEEKFKIKTLQIAFKTELHTCVSEVKLREKWQCHDFLHEIKTCYKKQSSQCMVFEKK